jgi:hypothetical protein
MRRLLVLVVAFLPWASPADALTIRDVIELTRAGLSDEVLLALVEVDRGVYTIDAQSIKTLKAAGVSERVIVALIRSGRVPRAEDNAETVLPPVIDETPPPPQVIVLDHHEPAVVREVAVPVPVYIPVVVRGRHRQADRTHEPSTFVPFQSGPALSHPIERHHSQPKTEPVYWGFGGKLRPDAWKPDGKHQAP